MIKNNPINNENECLSCGKETKKLLKCSKCKIVKYCSRECQKIDWKKHKKKCVNVNSSISSLFSKLPNDDNTIVKQSNSHLVEDGINKKCLLSLLSFDELNSIQSFLSIKDACNFEICSKICRLSSESFWNNLLLGTNSIDSRESTQFLPLFHRSNTPIHVKLMKGNSKKLCYYLIFNIIKLNFSTILSTVVSASSIDRVEESPINVLNISSCNIEYEKFRNSYNYSHIPDFTMGLIAARRCGCSKGHPCYWSSSPSTTPEIYEHITFKSVNNLSIAYGFSITAYRAFFQPDWPIYSPNTVSIQFFSDDDSNDDGGDEIIDLKLGRIPLDIKKKSIGLDVDGLMSKSKFVCYYESAQVNLEIIPTPQIFSFDRPIMVLPNSYIRIVLRGMKTQQTFQEEDGMENYDSYCKCYYLDILS
jgi:hypothetical protein